ncbi:MAG: hypothetical protein IJ422_00620 [Oscillospiraceae bacterium]|nr:hypothetical protein [Oscillospiraceae bacterium]
MAKVLLIGHNVLDARTAFGKTLISFFQDWDREDLAELYFHSEVPTTNVCSQYFRITDTDALRSVFTVKRKSAGRSFDQAQVDTKRQSSRVDTGIKQKLYSFGRKRTSGIYIARNMVWKLSKWYSEELQQWISAFSPDVIFFASGDYAFAYDIVYTISKKFDIPVVIYCCDDYYLNRANPDSILSRFVHAGLMRSVRRCISRACGMIAICDKMTQAYRALFDLPVHSVYTGYSAKREADVNGNGIVYLGNLGFSRHESLVDIGRALRHLSAKTGDDLYLDVYSAENREQILRELTEENGIRFHGSVGSEDVKRIIAQSRLVVHTESFQPRNIYKVQYAISTKIADLLASGRCIFAYGPDEVASMEYLAENAAGCVVNSKERLEEELRDILYNADRRLRIVKNAEDLANKNHSSENVSGVVRKIIENAVTKEG